jgi:hypothetical protein
MLVTLTQALIGVGGLAALLVILYGPWQAICSDIARQIVFEKRTRYLIWRSVASYRLAAANTV